jgi:hypothetical protein
MLRDEIIGILRDRWTTEEAEGWVSFDALAHALRAKIADVMFETGGLCERRLAERTGHRGADMIRLTQKGLDACQEAQ